MHDVVTDELVTRRPTVVEVDLSAITDNYRAIQSLAGERTVLCVLKANAYGHGLIRVAQHLQSIGVQYLGVAYLEEGILLRRSGVTVPILVMGGIVGDQIPHFIEHELTITASSSTKLQQIEDAARSMGKRATIHIKVDTGMERIGVHYYSAARLIEESLDLQHCDVEGIYTHLANAGDQSSVNLQLDRFSDVLQIYDSRGVQRPMVHYANSAGLLSTDRLECDMVRAGILLYGVYPVSDMHGVIEVRPALSWLTRVVYFKVVQPDHPVSYGSTWSTDKMTRVVTIPVGYGDGYMRAMSNRAHVLIRGQKYPNVGTICMDQMMVNIHWETAYNDDEVVLIGTQDDKHISVEDLALWADSIPYEILTNINTRVPRVYINAPTVD